MELVEACTNGDLQLVEKLLNQGENPNFYDETKGIAISLFLTSDTYPLLIATKNGNYAIAKLLINFKAEIKETLLVACENGNSDIAVLLIENGADINSGVAMMVAVENNFGDLVEILIRYGADPNRGRADVRITPLMEAASRGYLDIVQVYNRGFFWGNI
jgi:ankyrin repeat protein